MKATRILFALALCIGVPHAQAEERVPIEAFVGSDLVRMPRLSTDGRHFAVSLNRGEGRHAIGVYRLSDMVQTTLLTLPRYELPVQMHWVSAERLVIAKGKEMGSREEPIPMGEIIATDFDGKNQKYIYGYEQATRIAGLDRGFGYIEGLPIVPNGRFYMRRLSSALRGSMMYDVDAVKGTADLAADIGVKDLSFTLDRGGVARFASGVDEEDNFLLYRADPQGKDWQPVATQGDEWFSPFAFSSDGAGVFAWFNVNGGPTSLIRMGVGGDGRKVLATDAFANVGDVEWSPDWEPFAVSVGGGKPRVVYFDENGKEAQLHRKLAQAMPNHHVSYVNHSSDGTISLLFVHSDRDPGGWYLFERGSSKLSKLLAVREGIDAKRMGERRYIRFKASDGMELDGYLTLPAGVQQPTNLPMVLLPHGGPHAPGDGWAFDVDAQFLASRGYLVLQVNYRGSKGRGRGFMEAGYGKWGTRVQDDLIDGMRWAVAQGHADAKRICVYGASFGGYSAMMTAARAPDLVKCVASLSGLYDLDAFARKSDVKTSGWGRNYLERAIGGDKDQRLAQSPIGLVAKIKAPVFMAHGEIDKRTPFAQAKAMREALDEAGKPPEWMPVPKEGHGFYETANGVEFYRRLEAFLDKHIGAGAG